MGGGLELQRVGHAVSEAASTACRSGTGIGCPRWAVHLRPHGCPVSYGDRTYPWSPSGNRVSGAGCRHMATVCVVCSFEAKVVH